MTEQARRQMCGSSESQYATREDFLQIFKEEINRLYQLLFLLTGDHQKAERCCVASIDDCARENRVFREWACVWAKRVIVENAIRELNLRQKHSNSSAVVPTAFSNNRQLSGPTGHFGADAVLRLADFDRFVFVLCVLERHRAHECALLLGCPAPEVREARARAIAELASIDQMVPFGRKATIAAVSRSARGSKDGANEGTCT